MAIDSEIVKHLAGGGYHPRSSRHSDFQSLIIIRDLVAQCPLIGHRAASGEIVANSGARFWSPLRKDDDITVHTKPKRTARKLAQETVDIFRSIHLRNSNADVPGMEAIGVVVVEHDNLATHPNAAKYASITKPT